MKQFFTMIVRLMRMTWTIIQYTGPLYATNDNEIDENDLDNHAIYRSYLLHEGQHVLNDPF